MKIFKKNKKNNLPVIITVLMVVLLLCGGYTAYANFNGLWPFTPKTPTPINTVDLNPPTEEQQNNGNDIKDAAIEAENKPASQGEVDVTITSANQNDGVFQVRALIQVVTNSGNCTLTMTNESKVVTKTSAVQALSTASTCAGFDIPTTELSNGTWSLSISFKNDTVNGSISQKVEIK